MRTGTVILVGVFAVSAFLVPFAIGPSGTTPDPVRFGETIQTGLSSETVRVAQAKGHTIPKVQVFYAQSEFVVGYYGVSSFARSANRDGRTQRFGPPVAIYVSAFPDASPRLTSDGFVNASIDTRATWVRATAAQYAVVPTPTSTAVVPFTDATAARSFAARHDGQVRSWQAVRDEFDERAAVDRPEWPTRRSERANETVAAVRPLLDRPVSTVVGRDAPTIQAAIRDAPPNTTVRVPPGRYEEQVRIAKPITLQGAGRGTHLAGEGNGTVVTVASSDAAVADLRISGVGTTRINLSDDSDRTREWDSKVEQTYGRGDAGVAVLGGTRTLVQSVTVETPSNGLLYRNSSRAVASDVTVRGNPTPNQGYMGVMAMGSPVVVQHSTFRGGLDGVYAHRSDGMVVRDSAMSNVRFGVHVMFTSETLLADNTVRDAQTGLVIMTRPTGNALVGNDVRASRHGIVTAGTRSYVADNVLVDNGVGLTIGSRTSRYVGNVVAGNDLGVRAENYVASNRVVGNDFVDNREQVHATAGMARVWSTPGRGNYWDGAISVGSNQSMRPYAPLDPVDATLREPGRLTLAHSPIHIGRRLLQQLVPGMRAQGIVDRHPATTPLNPVRLGQAGYADARQEDSHS
ncbi:NosD domain-containing protein [Halorientalis brevis]|uniref:NosD domain-containing protein n=1 Tax=Halorientalis brevis TaxID=1126241 RepID=A0ABD6CDR4_9EURY|nr:NosD domain-containing protein [Halorientalis brevis]